MAWSVVGKKHALTFKQLIDTSGLVSELICFLQIACLYQLLNT